MIWDRKLVGIEMKVSRVDQKDFLLFRELQQTTASLALQNKINKVLFLVKVMLVKEEGLQGFDMQHKNTN